jgi:hypothetical protein
MDDYPSNSRTRTPPPDKRPRMEIQDEPAPEQEVKLEKVVTGRVIRRKKPLGRRIMDTFFSGDSNSVVGYLAKEVLLPALQNLVTDFVTQGIEKAVYGEVRTAHRSSRGSTFQRPHVSYDRYASAAPERRPTPTTQPRRMATQPSSFDVGSIIVEDKVQAQVIADRLFDTLDQYGCVTVGNLNELLGQTSSHVDYKWGWTDLNQMTSKRVREGYLIVLPEPEDLR